MAKTKENSDVKPLGASWSPPSVVPGTDQGPGHPLVCLATTYTFSATLLETELLPRFLGLQFDPTEREPAFLVEREDALEKVTAAVLVDQSKVDNHQTTLRWDQIAVRVPQAIQHAKVVVLAWERMVRLIVGSANLSIPGYRHNREVVGVLDFFDYSESPPRVVLDEALDFLRQVLTFAAAEPRVIARVHNGIEATNRRMRKWDRMPREFTPREYPKVHFVPNLPRPGGGVARSVLKQVKDVWGGRTARDIRVVTPFVGNPDSKFEHLVGELAELPHLRSTEVKLAVPGVKSEVAHTHRVVMLPCTFRDAWMRAWKCDAADMPVCVVIPEANHGDRLVERPLHAKGVFLSDGDLSLLCCGSSNFSASGMGVGRANIEANLVYLDRTDSALDDSCLEYRLPVDWAGDQARHISWSESPEVSEEDLEVIASLIPAVFLWATFNPVSATLLVRLDVNQPLPKTWSLRLHHAGLPVLASNEQYTAAPDDGQLTIALPGELLGFPVTTLRVLWHDGEKKGEALLPVQVADRKLLPPPAALQSLTSEAILACILSGCDPAEWVDREMSRVSGRVASPPIDPGLDPHRFHDPSGLALYRVRRLGRGLAAMGQRIVKTVRTPEAVEYQLHRHPLGPMCFTEAIVREAVTDSSVASKMDHARLVFSMLEIGLMMAHAGKRLHVQRQSGEADHRPCFRRAVTRVLQQAEGLMQTVASADGDARISDNLLRYRDSVKQQAVDLLAGLHCEEEVVCP